MKFAQWAVAKYGKDAIVNPVKETTDSGQVAMFARPVMGAVKRPPLSIGDQKPAKKKSKLPPA